MPVPKKQDEPRFAGFRRAQVIGLLSMLHRFGYAEKSDSPEVIGLFELKLDALRQDLIRLDLEQQAPLARQVI